MKTLKELRAGDFLTPTIPFMAWNRTKSEKYKYYYSALPICNNMPFMPKGQKVFIEHIVPNEYIACKFFYNKATYVFFITLVDIFVSSSDIPQKTPEDMFNLSGFKYIDYDPLKT